MSKAPSPGCVFGPSCSTMAPMPTLKLKKVFNPETSTGISTSNILRTIIGPEVDGKESSFSCIASNLGSPECKTTTLNLQNGAKATPGTGNDKCIAFCPTNPASKYAHYKSSGTGKNKTWGWSQINMESIPNNDTISKLNEQIKYDSPSGPVTCSFTNANSENCKVMGDLAGCQAYCIPKDTEPKADTGFLIEQRCPDNKNSCDRNELVWNRK
jgi:hypothetical protein